MKWLFIAVLILAAQYLVYVIIPKDQALMFALLAAFCAWTAQQKNA